MTYEPTYFKNLPEDRVFRGEDGVEPYVFDEALVIAVDVALATDRPLLVSGNPGCGKSRLADAVAAVMQWNLLSVSVTSRTRLETLTAEVDQLRRLHDAQSRGEGDLLKPDAFYLNPGVFWWAFAPGSARRRGLAADEARALDAEVDYPGVERDDGSAPRTVLLVDEIDKAEPDLPNDLLEPLDRQRFDLPVGFRADDESQVLAPVRAAGERGLLTVITTNGERELPPAFVRRCVQLDVPDPGFDRLVAIGETHYPSGGDAAKSGRNQAIAKLIDDFREVAEHQRVRAPGTAEFLDAIKACEELEIAYSEAEDSVWRKLERAVLDKDGQLRAGLGAA